MINILLPTTRKTENSNDLYGRLKTLEEDCRTCAPITPFECLNGCRVYKLKNELRQLREAMDNPNYIEELFNVLKNETRLCILQAIEKGNCALDRIQNELKKTGHSYCQETLIEDYLARC